MNKNWWVSGKSGSYTTALSCSHGDIGTQRKEGAIDPRHNVKC